MRTWLADGEIVVEIDGVVPDLIMPMPSTIELEIEWRQD